MCVLGNESLFGMNRIDPYLYFLLENNGHSNCCQRIFFNNVYKIDLFIDRRDMIIIRNCIRKTSYTNCACCVLMYTATLCDLFVHSLFVSASVKPSKIRKETGGRYVIYCFQLSLFVVVALITFTLNFFSLFTRMNDSLTHIPKYLSSADVCYSEELKTLPVHKHRGDLFIFLRANFDVC